MFKALKTSTRNRYVVGVALFGFITTLAVVVDVEITSGAVGFAVMEPGEASVYVAPLSFDQYTRVVVALVAVNPLKVTLNTLNSES